MHSEFSGKILGDPRVDILKKKFIVVSIGLSWHINVSAVAMHFTNTLDEGEWAALCSCRFTRAFTKSQVPDKSTVCHLISSFC